MSTETATPLVDVKPQGMRKNGTPPRKATLQPTPAGHPNRKIGKQWHAPKAAFRPKAGNSTFEKRQEERKAMDAVKAKEKEMKDEKEADRQVRCPLP